MNNCEIQGAAGSHWRTVWNINLYWKQISAHTCLILLTWLLWRINFRAKVEQLPAATCTQKPACGIDLKWQQLPRVLHSHHMRYFPTHGFPIINTYNTYIYNLECLYIDLYAYIYIEMAFPLKRELHVSPEWLFATLDSLWRVKHQIMLIRDATLDYSQHFLLLPLPFSIPVCPIFRGVI